MDSFGFQLACLSREEASARLASAASTLTQDKFKAGGLTNWEPAHGPAPAKLKTTVRKGGIPPALRPGLWYQFSGGAARRRAEAAPNALFARLLRRAAAGSAVNAADVGAELARAFGPHALLGSVRGVVGVTSLLQAYEQYSRLDLGAAAWTGLTRIAGLLLVVFSAACAEDAFWTLVALVEDRLPASCVLKATRAGAVEQRVLEALAARRCPRLVAALAAADAPLASLAAPWFPALFAGALPAETVARVWDCLMLEGPKVLFRVALALSMMHETALASSHSVQIERAFKWRVARTFNSDALLKLAFNGVGPLPMAAIKRARADLEGAADAQAVEHQRRLEALCAASQAAAALRRPSSESSTERLPLATIEESDESEADI
ncbi:hypothetical protein WJX81_000734 [Elliptochloris bilobata]|uniref:Rab-GAP TBC domain-containing protein n=1 Tax=Elliptochloris bilobata TaxID=381761 RepID=A0AAW1SI58_9CHLO